MDQLNNTPELAQAGNGLPWLEAFFARHIVFPVTTRQLDATKAVDLVVKNGTQALNRAKSVPHDLRHQQTLIDRFTGIEDSSRYWSVVMTLHHLVVTGDAMANITEQLAYGKPVEYRVQIDAVKPSAQASEEWVFSSYEQFLSGYAQRMHLLTPCNLKANRHEHPWFGPITAHQWLCLNAMHHQIHLKQIEKIIAKLA